MEIYKIKGLSFTYPNRTTKALDNINLSVKKGEFICLCGKSGCGKTTLLRLLKSSLAPFGEKSGEILFMDKPLTETEQREEASQIGFVMQSPENQIVTDKVWHELAFGLESLGYSTPQIRARVSETAAFFGIGEWFHKKVTELSGGQKQLLNLASIMVMQPSVLILDEPTSQLDPIAANEFLAALVKINQETGTTVILSEHRLEEVFSISDRVIVMDNATILADGKPNEVGEKLKNENHDMYSALPAAIRVYNAIEGGGNCPVTVRDGRIWLENYAKENPLKPELIPIPEADEKENTIIELSEVYFRYAKELPDVVKNMNVKINKGEIFAILGGNGSGKTTTLSLMSGLNTPYRGEVLIKNKKLSEFQNPYDGLLGVLPQNPQTLFVKQNVYLDLMEMLSDKKIPKAEKDKRIKETAILCKIDKLLGNHPHDLSGGEQQRAALAKVLLKEPEILLLDEPTKGLDAHFKQIFADILIGLKRKGVTVVMVSHDIEFCAEFADRCSIVFDGNFASVLTTHEFFKLNNFYTTSANRMAKDIIPDAILADDIILACGGEVDTRNRTKITDTEFDNIEISEENKKTPKLSTARIVLGIGFALVFILFCVFCSFNVIDFNSVTAKLIGTVMIMGCLVSILPDKEIGINVKRPKTKRKLTKRTIVAAILVLIAIPITIYTGIYYFGDRKYYLISLLIILEIFIPFCMVFEGRKPQARELVVISVLCAVAVAGRTAFFMLPQFKPVVAIVIISGVCFGGETGFLVGAVTGFVSNFFFGQGPWTPWQMFAFGITGFFAGVFFRKGLLRKTRASLSIFGFIATIVLYGGIVNIASVIMWQTKPTTEMIISAYAMGIPFDLIHAISTAFYLWLISGPMIEKIERIKLKYGLIEQ